uniref:Uncharacterized protein n=1 Tax=Amphimedon queenslandica TaxID=400682 RepID=A0A1X7UEK1_AMPQE
MMSLYHLCNGFASKIFGKLKSMDGGVAKANQARFESNTTRNQVFSSWAV